MEQLIILSLIAIISVFLTALIRGIHKRLSHYLHEKQHHWERGILHAVHAPLICSIWFVALLFSLDTIKWTFIKENWEVIWKGGSGLLLLWFLIGCIRQVEEALLRSRQGKAHVDRTTVRAISQMLRLILFFIVLFACVQIIFDVPPSGLIAFLGGGGIILGFAAKEILSNFFGGLFIFVDRPFGIGDWVRSPDHEIEGCVEYIGWRHTCIRTLDKRPLYVPNALFSTISLENVSRMSHRRIFTRLGVRYEDLSSVDAISHSIEQMLRAHPDMDSNESIYVQLISFAPSSLEIEVSAYTSRVARAEYLALQHELFIKMAQLVTAQGAQLAYPTTTVLLPTAP